MTILPKAIYTFNAIPSKVPKALFVEMKKSTPEFIGDYKEPQIVKTRLKKKK